MPGADGKGGEFQRLRPKAEPLTSPGFLVGSLASDTLDL